MIIKQNGLENVEGQKVITSEKLFDVLVGALYASDFSGQTSVGDLQLMAAIYRDLPRFDLKSKYGDRGLVTRLLTDFIKSNPQKRGNTGKLVSAEFIFVDGKSRSKKLKAKAIKLITLGRDKGEEEKIENLSSTLSAYCLHYLFGFAQ